MVYKLIAQMGFVAYPLIICSVIVCAIFLEQLIMTLVMRGVKANTSIHQAQKHRSINHIARLLKNNSKLDTEHRETLLGLEIEKLEYKMKASIVWLQFITSFAPMLGLLGTVLGVIDAFTAISQYKGSISPSVISAGLEKAMLTTAFGLIIAIPSQFISTFFERRIDKIIANYTQYLLIYNYKMFKPNKSYNNKPKKIEVKKI